MENKFAVQSLTFRGLAVMVVGYVLTLAGVSATDGDIGRLIDAVSALVFVVGSIAAAVGRVRAKGPIIGIVPNPEK